MKQDKIELYGWEVSPYMAKVEIYLKYKGIPFRTVRPNAYTLSAKFNLQWEKRLCSFASRSSSQNLVAKHPHVLKWIERLRGEISQDRIVLPDDESIPESLLSVLVHISQSHMPLIKQSVEAVRLWSRDKSIGDIIPQRIGDATLTIGKNQETRYNLIEPYWLFQRLCETYQMLENMDKHGVDEFISSVAGLSLIKEPLPINTELKKCRLYVAAWCNIKRISP
jgi:hypothetical protein